MNIKCEVCGRLNDLVVNPHRCYKCGNEWPVSAWTYHGP